jgi:hypothetical protein
MEKFTKIGYATVGRGPKHPEFPQTELQEEIDVFLSQYSFLQKDRGYVDFLECYAGAMIDSPEEKLVINIFGFLEDISLHLLEDESSIIDDQGFYAFCSSVVRVEEGEHPYYVGSVGLGYTFDATGTRRWGVYRSIEGEPCEWYCNSFLDWLEKLIARKGKLL